MAGPFKSDSIEIDPSKPGSRFISSAANGQLQFEDSLTGAPIKLAELSGVGSLQNVVTVSASGGQYATIQGALDAIPVTSSETSPWLVLVGSGVYFEDILIQKDGVTIQGLGRVVLRSAFDATPNINPASTITLSSGASSNPQSVKLENLIVTNSHQNQACIDLQGGLNSLVGANQITLENVILSPTSNLGNLGLRSDTVGNVVWLGGSFTSASAVATNTFTNTASVRMQNVSDSISTQIMFNSANPTSNTSVRDFVIVDCSRFGEGSTLTYALQSSLSGAGNLRIEKSSFEGKLVLQGDQSVSVLQSSLLDVDITSILQAVFSRTSRQVLSTVPGAVLDEDFQSGEVSFTNTVTETVALPSQHSDASYRVFLELSSTPLNQEVPVVQNKTTSGFDIVFTSNQTITVGWALYRR